MRYFSTDEEFWASVDEAIYFYEVSIENTRNIYHKDGYDDVASTTSEGEVIDILYLPESFSTFHMDMLFAEKGARLFLYSNYEESFGRYLNKNELKEIIVMCISYKEELYRNQNWNFENLKLQIDHPLVGRLGEIAAGNNYWMTPIAERLFYLHDKYIVINALAMISAYQSEMLLCRGEIEKAIELATIAQRADDISGFLFDLDEREEQQSKKKSDCAKAGVARRVESLFREAVFIPSWLDWQNGELNYPTQESFLREMDRQAETFLENHGSKKQNIHQRTFLYWIKDLKTEN